MSIELATVTFFLGISLLLYILMGGADFGAGILEIFLGRRMRREQRELISKAIAPIWEANHIWLIIAIVILFMGFPEVYTTVCVHLFLPVTALLIGIVARGCAFTFRHYDTPKNEYYRLYSAVFALSSLWSAFFIGIIAGAATLGRIDVTTIGFYESYLDPWVNWFCLSMGGFTASLFTLLAAIYLVGEARTDELRSVFRRKAKYANAALVTFGALVFIFAEVSGRPLLRDFFNETISAYCFLLGTCLLIPFWRALKGSRNNTLVRALGVSIVITVVLGWFAQQYPTVLELAGRPGLTLFNASAPPATIGALALGLLVGTALIFPALAYLFAIFKRETF